MFAPKAFWTVIRIPAAFDFSFAVRADKILHPSLKSIHGSIVCEKYLFCRMEHPFAANNARERAPLLLLYQVEF